MQDDEGTDDMAKDDKAVALKDDTATALALVPTTQDVEGVMEALGGEQLSISLLERVKLTPGGVTRWDVVDGESTGVLEGVLMLKQATRVYWKERYSGSGGVQPDCSSLDNATGKGNRQLDNVDEPEDSLHECKSCPLADWGTAFNEKGESTNGKACRQVTRLFLLREGEVLPMLIALPPSSYQAALKYAVTLASKHMPYYAVKTRLTLEKTHMKSGFDVAVAKFENAGPLSDEERVAVLGYRDQLLPFLTSLSVMDVEANDASVAGGE